MSATEDFSRLFSRSSISKWGDFSIIIIISIGDAGHFLPFSVTVIFGCTIYIHSENIFRTRWVNIYWFLDW